MSKETVMPALSKKAWQELNDLKVKLKVNLVGSKERIFETYEEYLEDNKKNPVGALFG